MKKSILPVLSAALLSVLVLSACVTNTPTATPVPSPTAGAAPTATGEPAPVETGYPYPEPVEPEGEVPAGTAYPVDPSEDGPLPLQSEPGSAYPPEQADAGLQRGEFFLDSIAVQPSANGQGSELFVEGSLPTPCHAPRAVIRPPDDQNRIVVELYSVFDPNRVCAQVIQPFSGSVAAFTELPSGSYQVMVDGQAVGQFTAQ